MPIEHRVRQGECLPSIACAHGFADWRVIYDHPDNAQFRALRPNPHVIHPGDTLTIPDLTPREETCASEQRHRFRAKRQPTFFNLCLQDPGKQPLADKPYRLVVGSQEYAGRTDSAGWIKCRISASAETGFLSVSLDPADPERVMQWQVRLGHLDPLDTTSGLKARLTNLGYRCGEVNDIEDDQLHAALRRFQEDHGLTVTGSVDSQTRQRLEQEHSL